MTIPLEQDARLSPRVDAADLPPIGIRLSPHGVDARLINISATGALIETTARVQPGGTLCLNFDSGFGLTPVEGRVVRSAIVAVAPGGKLRYQLGVAFTKTIELPELFRERETDRQAQEPDASEPIGAGNRW